MMKLIRSNADSKKKQGNLKWTFPMNLRCMLIVEMTEAGIINEGRLSSKSERR